MNEIEALKLQPTDPSQPNPNSKISEECRQPYLCKGHDIRLHPVTQSLPKRVK